MVTEYADGADQQFRLKSGWPQSMPLSMIAIALSVPPREMSHASEALMSAPGFPLTPFTG
jgi:hypothetical protein